MEERKMILKMIEEGKITAEEGVKLLEAMGTKEEEKASTAVSTSVDWDHSEQKQERRKEREREWGFNPSKLTEFVESAIQKIKDFDLDFNFGSFVTVDHIFQHRNVSPASLDISLENGPVTLIPWDEPDVRIECNAKVYRVKDTEEARKLFLQEATFRVDERKLLFHTRVKTIKVETKVFVPKRSFETVKIYSFNGEIKGDPVKADTLDVNTLNGPITFEKAEAKKLMAETVNGGIELRGLSADVVDMKTINGGITVTGAMQDLDAETVNGSIVYELEKLNESGFAELKATTGSIEVSVPTSLRVEGKLKTNVGGYSCRLSSFEILEERKDFAHKVMSFVGNQEQSPRLKITALTNTGAVVVKDR
ncbi:BH3593 [Halalkalibacterium halodurans C-125]|uniref:BH3593 protein n=1 Tax=Halalkalibacterium halodurans (strain ATCC BAA-125 / DSM 18197 / FERM 7344 / JCM 9153 / C-125) TaxID=272558 RepID=Q9K6Y1_HALH5|nr:DUF4097 domain-containing protein [Halalkalibacterium halodurans]BAB07312.1 BH3593 [Halalkalibacterium halodurans C-125]